MIRIVMSIKYLILCMCFAFMVPFLGCTSVDYSVTIGNETQYDLRFRIRCRDYKIFEFVDSGAELMVAIAVDENDNSAKASKFIWNIWVSKADHTPLIHLEGDEIDKRMIRTGKAESDVFFRFEVKEDDFGFGVDKKINFEEEIDEYQIDHLNEY